MKLSELEAKDRMLAHDHRQGASLELLERDARLERITHELCLLRTSMEAKGSENCAAPGGSAAFSPSATEPADVAATQSSTQSSSEMQDLQARLQEKVGAVEIAF